MQQKKIPLQELSGVFSGCFLDYIRQKDSLHDLYYRFPKTGAFKDQIEEKKKSFPKAYRNTLYTSLKEQYKMLTIPDLAAFHLEAIKKETTFTVTTGHQLNIFTGPLYVIYKIVSTINLCKQLQKTYPDYTFVPIYWMASEDHDIEEINHLRIYGEKHTWKTMQQGGVGRFDPRGLKTILDEIPGDITLFRKAYLTHNRLSDAVRYYINELFGKEGLLVLDADCRALKKTLQRVMTDDIFHHTTQSLVEKSNILLKQKGYTPAIHVRKINFFYLDDGIRGRLDVAKDRFFIPDTNMAFEKDQIKKLIDEEPEKLSPNVAIRPLYQETILPDIAYIGGPAEIVYWLQLKQLFDHHKTLFPILIPRNFALIIDGSTARKLQKTTLAEKDFFKDTHQLQKQWTKENTSYSLSLKQEKEQIKMLFDHIAKRTNPIDKTLNALAHAEARYTVARLEKIERKMIRAEKRKHADKLSQISTVKKTLFPGGNLQERTDNFLNFYQQDHDFIKKLLEKLNPLDFRFNVLSYPFS